MFPDLYGLGWFMMIFIIFALQNSNYTLVQDSGMLVGFLHIIMQWWCFTHPYNKVAKIQKEDAMKAAVFQNN